MKTANPAATYTCDPVMGNATSGCFVHPAIPPLLREQVVPHADVITPNQFELGFLTGTEPRHLESTLASADAGAGDGPVDGAGHLGRSDRDRPEDTIEMLAVTGDGAWIVQTPRLPIKANGSGDVTAALFTAHLRDDRLARRGARPHRLVASSASCRRPSTPASASCRSCSPRTPSPRRRGEFEVEQVR